MYAVDVDRIPVAITDLMEKFSELPFKEKIRLAGGAPRDLLLGAPVSDWDFFVHSPPLPSIDLAIADALYGCLFLPQSDPVKSKYTGEKIFDTTTWRNSSGDKVQIILSHQTIDLFDISTCQVALDMQGKVYVTDAFRRSVDHSVHTVYLRAYKTHYQFIKGLTDHVPRIVQKYPWPIRLDYDGVTKEQLKFIQTRGEF
jgi:hypothetical protein